MTACIVAIALLIVVSAALVTVACMISSRISREEERNGRRK